MSTFDRGRHNAGGVNKNKAAINEKMKIKDHTLHTHILMIETGSNNHEMKNVADYKK